MIQWSADEVEKYAQERSHELLVKNKIESDDQVFYRAGKFEFTSNYSEKDYKRRGRRECDWFKYCIKRVVELL